MAWTTTTTVRHPDGTTIATTTVTAPPQTAELPKPALPEVSLPNSVRAPRPTGRAAARPTFRPFDCDPLPFAVVPPSDAVTGAGAACAGGWVDEMDELRV